MGMWGSRGGSVPPRQPRRTPGGGDGTGTGAAAGAGVAIWKVLHQTVLCLVRERRESEEIARLWLPEAGLRAVMWGLCGPQDILGGGALLVLLGTPCCWLFVRTGSRGKRSANSRSSWRASGWRVAPPRKQMVRRGPEEASWGKISTQLLRAQQGELRRSPRGGKGEHKQGVPAPLPPLPAGAVLPGGELPSRAR